MYITHAKWVRVNIASVPAVQYTRAVISSAGEVEELVQPGTCAQHKNGNILLYVQDYPYLCRSMCLAQGTPLNSETI